MKREINLKIERRKETTARAGHSNSTLHNKIKAGLWVPPVSLGERAVGFFKHETDELLAAYANNFDPDEIRTLVKQLVTERKDLLGASHG